VRAPDRLLPDVESMVVFHLKDDAEVEAIVDRRVSTERGKTFPCVTVLLLPGRWAVDGFLAAPTVQIDSWGNTRLEARNLAYVVQRSCARMPGTFEGLGVVTGVEDVLLPGSIPEEEGNPSHYTSEVRVFCRSLNT
jgi:hypothetical protein